jgi:hypothetical protein
MEALTRGRKRSAKSSATRPQRGIGDMTDDELIDAIVAQSKNPPDVQREMIESTLALHVYHHGDERGRRVWRASMEGICRRGCGENEAESEAAQLLKVA